MCREGRKKSRARNGFTLLELMLVIVIIGIFGVLTIQNLDSLDATSRMRTAIRGLKNQILKSRRAASAYSESVYLVYDLDEKYFWLEIEKIDVPEGATEEEKVDIIFEEQLPLGVQFEDIAFNEEEVWDTGLVRARAFPNGSVQSMVIHLHNENDFQVTLEVNPLSGQVTRYDEYLSYEVLTDVDVPEDEEKEEEELEEQMQEGN